MESHKDQANPSTEFRTWLGFEVRDSASYPGRVYVTVSEVGLRAMEACHDGWLWEAVIQIDNEFEGKATSSDRAEARALAERRLVTAIAQNPDTLESMLLIDVLALVNPAVVTGDTRCFNLS